MNSKHGDKAFMAMLEAEVREQQYREVRRTERPENVYRSGCKGSTLHFRGRGRQGYRLISVSGWKT